ncbi:MAG: hypothetical protein AAF487_13000, partial [Bacteroidota bacterium]
MSENVLDMQSFSESPKKKSTLDHVFSWSIRVPLAFSIGLSIMSIFRVYKSSFSNDIINLLLVPVAFFYGIRFFLKPNKAWYNFIKLILVLLFCFNAIEKSLNILPYVFPSTLVFAILVSLALLLL